MSTFKQRSDFFKLIASKNKLIAHNTIISGNLKRASFHRLNDEEELTAACESWAHFPCVVHIGHNLRFKQPQTGLPRKAIGNHLNFLTPLDYQGGSISKADAIENAFDITYTAMAQFISYLREEHEKNKNCGSNLFLFDLTKCKADQIGPIGKGSLYGWFLFFEDEMKCPEFIYDPTKWNN